MRKDLKNFDIYLQKLELYCKALKIKLIYKEVDSDASWIPSKRVIQIDSDLEESEEIASILHELGHALDDHVNLPSKQEDRAYAVIYKDKFTTNQALLVLKREYSAWFYAKGIARLLGIRLGKWFTLQKISCLNDYRQLYTNAKKGKI